MKIAQRKRGDKHPKGLAGKFMVVTPAGLLSR
jgi:hypothetical protein